MPRILREIPNFRDIHIATLGRATAGTGEWIYVWELYCIWVDINGHIRVIWGSGIRKSPCVALFHLDLQ
jgi:hypothetical protein